MQAVDLKTQHYKQFIQKLESLHVEYADGVQWAYTVFRNMLVRIPGLDSETLANVFGQLLISADGANVDEFEASNLVQQVFSALEEHGNVDNGIELQIKKSLLLDALNEGIGATVYVRSFLKSIYMSIRNVEQGQRAFDDFRQATQR